MSWFLYALVCLFGWGTADLFYKKGTDETDRYSHLKIAVWVGLVMGVSAFVLLPFTESSLSGGEILKKAVLYLPASLSYIVSMVIGYAGLRYLELSIVSPVQNASGALATVCMLVFFLLTGRITSFFEDFSALDLAGSVLIVLGVVCLAVVEQKLSSGEKDREDPDRKYRFGALALLFPLLYCVFDTIGTAADGIILDEASGLALGEIDVLVLYGLTFLLAGIAAYIYLWIREKRPYDPFAFRKEGPKALAAVCEEFGQIFYVFAMAKNPVLAAPMVASYCIVSVILSRVFLKEKMTALQKICVLPVILGIVLLGISEGVSMGG